MAPAKLLALRNIEPIRATLPTLQPEMLLLKLLALQNM